MNIPIKITSDDKGYFDRECPNCQYTFKIKMEDWKEKVSDEEVHCPMCGHVDTSDKWWTQEQLESIRKIASSWAMSYAEQQLGKTFKELERSTRNSKFIKFTYNSNKKASFINNPIGQMEEWETEITCEKCGTRYSVIGSAYFCPCCGFNSAVSIFYESLDTTKKMIDSLPKMKTLFAESLGRDKAETMCRSLLESTLGEIISAFQKFASCQYDKLTGQHSRVNDFQIVEKGSELYFKAFGKGYQDWLSADELKTINVLFQRRHLLEHNEGMVDQKYIEKSGDTSYVIGQRIVVREADTQELINIIIKLSKKMLELDIIK